MITATVTREVASSADHAFDVVVRHQAENHPRWEKEVVEVRRVGPESGLGARSVMVRREIGRTREVENTCVEYVDGRRAAYEHTDPGMDFWIAFDTVPAGPSTCHVTATVRLQPRGMLRALGPVLRLGTQRRTERITARMCEVIESVPAYGGADR